MIKLLSIIRFLIFLLFTQLPACIIMPDDIAMEFEPAAKGLPNHYQALNDEVNTLSSESEENHK